MAANNVKTADKELQEKQEILTGIINKDSRKYTFTRKVSIGGQEKEGTFTFRYPTVGDRLRQGIAQSALLEGRPIVGLDVVTYNIAYSISYLRSTMDSAPAWFDFEQMDNTDELLEMFREVEAFADTFRTKDDKTADAAGGKTAAGAKAVATR